MYDFKLHPDPKLTKVQQIVRAIALDIDKGVLQKDDHLPTINVFSRQHNVARDTIEKAYKELKREGYITAIASKGYYVKGKSNGTKRILLIFNKLSSYKKMVYDSFLETLGKKGKVDLHIHHYNPKLLGEIIDSSLGNYHYYVIMPHFFSGIKKQEYLKVIKKIPETELVLLDKNLPELQGSHIAVYQDFRRDIYEALSSANDLLKKYKRLTIVFPKYSNHPPDITKGALQFSQEHNKTLNVISSSAGETLQNNTVYIVITEADLAVMLKKVRASPYKLGKDVGIISFNETILKELLDITVVSTDFEEMGRSTANMILNKDGRQVRNPFKMIRRSSL
jgi:DNA-binding transcriptional regulator YhcF (GntR family)